MLRINSLNSITSLTTPKRTLRRTQSSPALIEGRGRLAVPNSALQEDDELIRIGNTNNFTNTGAMIRHMDAIGIHNEHIGNILWSMMDSNAHILDEDLFNANIEHRGLEGLMRASLIEMSDNNIQSISDNSRTNIAYKPNDNAPAA